MEGEVTRVKSLLRQKEREVEQVSQVASKLTNEKDNVADVVRQEFADRCVIEILLTVYIQGCSEVFTVHVKKAY